MIDGLTIRVHASPIEARENLEAPGLAGYAFGRFAWLQAWSATLGASASTRCAIVVVADTRVRMVLPLGITRRNGLRVLEFLGGVVTDYNAPLVESDFAMALDAPGVEALWRRIGAVLPPHDVIRLLRMPAFLDAPEGAGAPRVANPLAHLQGTRVAGGAMSLTLAGTYAAVERGLKPKVVKDTRRCLRRLQETGAVELTVAEDSAAMHDVLAALKRMKSRRWLDTKAKDWFADPSFAAFYDAMGELDLPDGRVHGSLLTVAGTPVAGHLGLVYRDRFYLLLLGWEAGEWQRFSTGRLIVDALIRTAISDGLRVFDFTVGEESYKQNWTDTKLALLSCERAVSTRGRIALKAQRTLDLLRTRAKRVDWLRDAVRRLTGRPSLSPVKEPRA